MAQTLRQTEACPVCQMPVSTRNPALTAQCGGRIHYFCSDSCRQRFLAEDCHQARPKGRWARFLDRLARANQKEFGSAGPCCH